MSGVCHEVMMMLCVGEQQEKRAIFGGGNRPILISKIGTTLLNEKNTLPYAARSC
jgi:hypothetical protein